MQRPFFTGTGSRTITIEPEPVPEEPLFVAPPSLPLLERLPSLTPRARRTTTTASVSALPSAAPVTPVAPALPAFVPAVATAALEPDDYEVRVSIVAPNGVPIAGGTVILNEDITRASLADQIVGYFGQERVFDALGRIPDFTVEVQDPISGRATNLVGGESLGRALERPGLGSTNAYVVPIVLRPARTNAARGFQAPSLYGVENPYQRMSMLIDQREAAQARRRSLFLFGGRGEDEYVRDFQEAADEGTRMRLARAALRTGRAVGERDAVAAHMLREAVLPLYDGYIGRGDPLPPGEYDALLRWLVEALVVGRTDEGVDYNQQLRRLTRDVLQGRRPEFAPREWVAFVAGVEEAADEARFREGTVDTRRLCETGHVHRGSEEGEEVEEQIECTSCGRWRTVAPGFRHVEYEASWRVAGGGGAEEHADCEQFGFEWQFASGERLLVPLNSSFVTSEVLGSEADPPLERSVDARGRVYGFAQVGTVEGGYDVQFVEDNASAFLPDAATRVYDLGSDAVDADGTVFISRAGVVYTVDGGRALRYYCQRPDKRVTFIALQDIGAFTQRPWICGDVGMTSRNPVVQRAQRRIRETERLLAQGLLPPGQEAEERATLERLRTTIHLADDEEGFDVEETWEEEDEEDLGPTIGAADDPYTRAYESLLSRIDARTAAERARYGAFIVTEAEQEGSQGGLFEDVEAEMEIETLRAGEEPEETEEVYEVSRRRAREGSAGEEDRLAAERLQEMLEAAAAQEQMLLEDEDEDDEEAAQLLQRTRDRMSQLTTALRPREDLGTRASALIGPQGASLADLSQALFTGNTPGEGRQFAAQLRDSLRGAGVRQVGPPQANWFVPAATLQSAGPAQREAIAASISANLSQRGLATPTRQSLLADIANASQR